jgi:integrase
MSSVSKRGNKWLARWREVPGGPQTAKSFPRRIDAERYLVEIEHKLLTGSYTDPKLAHTTVADFYSDWVERKAWRDSTRASVEWAFSVHILPALGGRRLGQLKAGDVERFEAALPLAASTVGTVHQYLTSLLEAAVEDDLIAKNPARRARRSRGDGAPIVPPTVEQIVALTAAAPPMLKAAAVLGAGAGLRQGECMGLGLASIDFLRRAVTINRQLVTPVSGKPYLGPPKTAASYRSIPVADVVLESLAEHAREHGTGEDGLLFRDHHDGPIGRNRFGDLWRSTSKRAGHPTVRYHDLRHFFASVLLSSGVSIKACQLNLGHASAKVTLDTYGHLMPADDDRSRAALQSALGAPEDWLRTAEG